MNLIRNRLLGYGIESGWADVLASMLLVVIVIVLCLIANFITNQLLIRLITPILKKHFIISQKFLIKRKVFQALSHVIPSIIIYSFAPFFPTFQKGIEILALTYLAVVTVTAVNRMLTVFNDIYQTYEVAKTKPIKGYLQVVKIIVIIVGTITIISKWLDKSPVILLSGIGALSAVFLLIFRDSLLGLVAGVQLSANDMVRVGDWIEMPNYEADGDVIDISLNTVMVRNFDWTVTMIPSYALISGSFKNWRGMQESGGRRMKRSLYIDVTSIKSCSTEMIERFRHIDLLTEYITSREKEIEAYNVAHDTNDERFINGRALTNIGVFREYITQYLRHHPDILEDAMLMVRQLAPDKEGLPLEIYAFTKTIDITVYEKIQADIFDHLLVIAAYFELYLFQNPTGRDLKKLQGESIELSDIER